MDNSAGKPVRVIVLSVPRARRPIDPEVERKPIRGSARRPVAMV